MRTEISTFARSAVTTVVLAAALAGCQDSVTGPQGAKAPEATIGELLPRVSTAYADEGAIVEVGFTLLDSRGNSMVTRGVLTWDADRFEYQDGDLEDAEAWMVVGSGDGWLMIDVMSPLDLYQSELTFRFRALVAGDTDGFHMEAIVVSGSAT